jgi:ABC-type branched-chain amino acid transport systems, ATPase component
MLRVDNVVAGYTDVDILHGVSIQIDKNEIVTVIGPNGAGKSTLMKTIIGLTKFRGGEILFGGESIVGMRPDTIVRKGMGYVPQERNIFPTLTVLENLEIGVFVDRGCLDENLGEVLRIFPELRGRLHQKTGTMSGGEQKMVAVGRALITEPALLLLDEPSSALSPKLRDLLFQKIEAINETGTAITMVEQNAKKALAISDRGYILEMGKNRFEGEGKSLLEDADVRGLYLGG